MHPEAGGVRPFFTGVEYCSYAPSSRLAMAGVQEAWLRRRDTRFEFLEPVNVCSYANEVQRASPGSPSMPGSS